VFQTQGIYSVYSVGSTVTGTYTFDLSAANPAQSSSSGITPGSLWYEVATGGPIYGIDPLPSGLLFTSTLNGSPGYVTLPIGGTGVDSSVIGNNGTYQAGETQHNATGNGSIFASDIFLRGSAPIETADGLPQYSLATLQAIGSFGDEENVASGSPDYAGYMEYNITSMTAETTTTSLPEPATLPLVGLALAALGFMGKRKSR